MEKLLRLIRKNHTRIIALSLSLCMAFTYFAADTFAIYKSTDIQTDTATVASLGTLTFSKLQDVDITPGVDIDCSDFKITKAKAAQNDVPTWLVLSVEQGSFTRSDNRYYIPGNTTALKNWHDVGTAAEVISFDIASDWLDNVKRIDNKMYYGVQLAGNAQIEYSIVENDKIYVSAEINTDDTADLDNIIQDSPKFNCYLVSSYGFESFDSVCEELIK